MDKTNPVPQELTVNAGTFLGTAYSQIASITVTDVDIMIEFVYINPREKTKGQVVSRVTMPRQSGDDLAKAILNTIKLHEAQKKGKRNG